MFFLWQNRKPLWVDKIVGAEEMGEGVHGVRGVGRCGPLDLRCEVPCENPCVKRDQLAVGCRSRYQYDRLGAPESTSRVDLI